MASFKSLKSRHTWHYQDDSFLLLYDTLVKKNPLSKNKKKVVRNELDLFQMFQIYRKMRRQIWELQKKRV